MPRVAQRYELKSDTIRVELVHYVTPIDPRWRRPRVCAAMKMLMKERAKIYRYEELMPPDIMAQNTDACRCC